MADKLRKTIPLNITFADGEQPTSAKLNAVSQQARNGNAIIERAIGDIWNQSGDPNINDNPLQIPNLGRLLGANEYLNPALYPGTANFNYKENIGNKFGNLTTGHLLFKPDSTTIIVHTDPNSLFTTLVSNEYEVDGPGDYWIDTATGKFRVYDPLQGTEVIEYTVDPTDVADGWVIGTETLPGVIPDPGQAEFTSCRVSENSGVYYLHLPPRRPLTLSARETPAKYPPAVDLTDNTDGTTTAPFKYWQDGTTALTGANSDHYRYQLPREIQDTAPPISVGDEYPNSFFYLWDQNLNTILDDIIFKRPNAASISPSLEDYVLEISSPSIDLSTYVTASETEANYSNTGLSLITCGAPATRTLWTLISSFYKHSHKNDGVLDSTIRHSDLTNQNPPSSSYTAGGHNTRYPADVPDFSSSRWAYDDHTSLLSRAGSHGIGTLHRDLNDNAMLGDLVLASTVDSGNGIYLNNSGNSNRIYFGQHGSASIYSNSTQDILFDPAIVSVSNNGRIGIGTNNPARPLHIAKDVPVIRLEDTSTPSNNYAEITADSTVGGFILRADAGNTGSAPYIRFDVGGSNDLLRILENGNVGIGTTAPNSELEVNGIIATSDGAENIPSFTFTSDTDNGMFLAGTDELGFATAGNEAVRIDASGQVGIWPNRAGAGAALAMLQVQKGTLVNSSLSTLGDDFFVCGNGQGGITLSSGSLGGTSSCDIIFAHLINNDLGRITYAHSEFGVTSDSLIFTVGTSEILRLNASGDLVDISTPTKDLRIADAEDTGTAGSYTEDGYITIKVGGNTRYIRVYKI